MNRILVAILILAICIPAVVADSGAETSIATQAVYATLLIAAGLVIYFTPFPNIFSYGLVVWGIAGFMQILATVLMPFIHRLFG